MGYNKNVDKIIKMIQNHCMEIAEEVDKQFYIQKETIRAIILDEICDYLSPLPTHYEWYYDDCPYDFSGLLRKDGKVSLEQTISDFLFYEYTGEKEATYMSHMGFYYCTYGDELCYIGMKISHDILLSTTYEYLKNMGTSLTNLSEQDLKAAFKDDVVDAIYDEIYDNSLAMEFFFYEAIIDFLDIGEIFLWKLII